MGNATAMLSRKPSAELIAIIAVGVTVLLAALGQAAWLDGKIERVDVRLSQKIAGLDVKLSDEIKALDTKLSGEIKALDTKLSGEIKTLDANLGGEIKALDVKLSGEIKGVDDNLDERISNLQQGQAAIRERLAAVEGRVGEVPMLNRQQVES